MKFPFAPLLAVVGPMKTVVAPLRPVVMAITVSVLVVVHIVVEVLVAMLAYIYLNLYHMETFGSLIGMARSLLDLLTSGLESLSPELARQAYATLLGELGPKAFLLLVMGLVASTLVRFVLWLIGRMLCAVRGKPKTA